MALDLIFMLTRFIIKIKQSDKQSNYFFCGDGLWDMPLPTLCLIRLYLPSLFSIDNESKTHYVCHTFVKTQ